MASEVLFDVTGRLATVTLNRPERLNAWIPAMALQLREAIPAASADKQGRAIILTGTGRGFCAGAAVGGLQQRASGASLMRDPKINRSSPRSCEKSGEANPLPKPKI